MEKKAKILKSYRLSEGTCKALEVLAARHGVSPAKAIAVLVRAWESGVFTEYEEVGDKLAEMFSVAKET